MINIVLTLVFTLPVMLYLQKENLKTTLIDNTDPARWILSSDGEQPGWRGDPYLFKTWQSSLVLFEGESEMRRLQLNYNLETDGLEIATNEGIKIAPDGLICSWEVHEGKYISLLSLGYDCLESPRKHGLLLLEQDGLVLIRVWGLNKRNPTYHEKLALGDNNFRYIMDTRLVVFKDGDCLDLSGSDSKREKGLLSFLKMENLSKSIDLQEFDLKNESDLIRLLKLSAQN